VSFQALVEDAKSMREKVQKTKIPFLPPIIDCLVAGTSKASAMSPSSSEQSLAGLLGLIPASKCDTVNIGLEAYVRPIDMHSDAPIAEDPWAQPAVILMQVSREGDIRTSINPYSVNEIGDLVWASPGAVETPIVPGLVKAVKSLFTMEMVDTDTARELANWLIVNGYQVSISHELICDQDHTE
jgi:hypothetical protein